MTNMYTNIHLVIWMLFSLCSVLCIHLAVVGGSHAVVQVSGRRFHLAGQWSDLKSCHWRSHEAQFAFCDCNTIPLSFEPGPFRESCLVGCDFDTTMKTYLSAARTKTQSVDSHLEMPVVSWLSCRLAVMFRVQLVPAPSPSPSLHLSSQNLVLLGCSRTLCCLAAHGF